MLLGGGEGGGEGRGVKGQKIVHKDKKLAVRCAPYLKKHALYDQHLCYACVK